MCVLPILSQCLKKKMCTEGSSLINVILSIASLSITLNEKSICFYFKCVVGRNTTGIVWCCCCYNLCQDASTFIHHCFCSISAMSTWLFQNSSIDFLKGIEHNISMPVMFIIAHTNIFQMTKS